MFEKQIMHLHIPITPPLPYSAVHFLILIIGVCVTVISAVLAGKCSERTFRRLILIVGIALTTSELIKQVYYTIIWDGGNYDLSLLPLQLCSMPLYLCFIYLAVKNTGIKNMIACFLSTFTLLGGLCALIVPTELFIPSLLLTVQALFWHFALVFLGLAFAIRFSRNFSHRTFLLEAVFFLSLCLIAMLLNALLDPLAISPMRLFFIGKNAPDIPILSQLYDRYGWFYSSAAMIFAELFGGYLLFLLEKGIQSRKHPEIRQISG